MSNATADVPFIDPSEPGFSVRSEAVQNAREKSWYARTPYGIAVLRYGELKDMVMHPSLRQGSYRWPEHNDAHGAWAQWWKRIMLNVEGEDHARLRRLGAPAFAPKLVKVMIPTFQEIANDLIDAFIDKGRCEFMSEFAEPYATKVICALIGVSPDEWRKFADLANDMGLALGVNYKREEGRVDAATNEFFDIAKKIIADRRANPKDDFINALITANESKDKLSDLELYDMVVLAISGGVETTRNQLGLAMALFLDHPDQWDLLSNDPELGRAAVEEVMRLRPTTTWVTREAVEDFEYNGVTIEKGTTLHLISGCAGTDPRHFTPEFDITKERERHFGFGGGAHHCIGSPIARSDMTEALKLLSQRLKKPVYDGEPSFLPDSGNTGPITLPIRFSSD